MKPIATDFAGTEILAQLQSFDPRDQYHAVLSICDLGRTDLLPAVAPLIGSPLKDLRYLAVQAIGDLGRPNAAYFGPFLVPLLEANDPEMRQYAAEALGSMDYQAAIPAIERMLRQETDEESIHFTQRALRILRRQTIAEDSIPVFRMMAVDLSGAADQLAIMPASIH
ncbi:MAG: HEAT repeat domain-containing protein [Acidobacteria bacterium]|nr:HEAT repeat domain-containing protein [Acidobacteriota bacterium]